MEHKLNNWKDFIKKEMKKHKDKWKTISFMDK
jgi:hypothetical protein